MTALLAAIIAVPRPLVPDEIPFPPVAHNALQAISLKDEARGVAAVGERLPFEVRALGEAIRLLGTTEASGSPDAAAMRETVLERAGVASAFGDENLLRLRALQLGMFLRELETFERTGAETKELRELGGGLLERAQQAGWLRREKQGARMSAGQSVREVIFRKRWNELTGMRGVAFQTTLAEERAYYAFVLEHPVVTVSSVQKEDMVARCDSANLYMLRKVEELSRIDPEYPSDYARGILLLRLHRPREALRPLVDFVDTHDRGPYVLRARNTLREAQEEVAAMEP